MMKTRLDLSAAEEEAARIAAEEEAARLEAERLAREAEIEAAISIEPDDPSDETNDGEVQDK